LGFECVRVRAKKEPTLPEEGALKGGERKWGQGNAETRKKRGN